MSFLKGDLSSKPIYYSGLQLQTSSGSVPIPIVYGLARVAPNAIWNGNFIGKPVSGKSGGKGAIFGSGGGGDTYTCSIILGLCEGPINSIQSVWDNQSIYYWGYVASMNAPAIWYGTTPQTPWSYPPADQQLSYTGTAYIVDYQINLGQSATIDSYSFEISGQFQSTGANGLDADPALVIQDFLTNPQYGVGFPSSSIDTTTLLGSSGDSSYQSYCKALGLCISVALSDQETAASFLERLLQLTNTAAVWSGGVLKFIPYGDMSATGTLYSSPFITFPVNGETNNYYASVPTPTAIGECTFNPNVTPIYNLTDDDFIGNAKADPVLVMRTDPYLAYNMQILEIYQRTNYYDATPIEAWDQNAIEEYGLLRIAPTITAHEICDPAVAQTAAQLILQRGLYIRNTYTWTGSWELCLLEPMDLVTLTDPLIGLNNEVVRIISIEEDDKGFLKFTAEEFPPGVATRVEYRVQSKQSSTVADNAPAPPVNAPIIFEPPDILGDGLAIWMAVSGPPPSWGGCNVWFSSDGNSYTQVGAINGIAKMGVLAAPLPTMPAAFSPPTIDTADSLSIDLTESGGALASGSQLDMTSLNTLCYCDGELISYQNATLVGPNQYQLNPILRGAYSSTISAHVTGAMFARLDNAIFKYPFTSDRIGSTIYLKFQSYNAFGGGVQDLSDCGAYPYTIKGSALSSPLPTVQNLVVAFPAGIASLSFDEVTDFRTGIRYKIFQGPSAATAQQVGDIAHPPFALSNTGTYYVQAYCQPVPGLVASSALSAGLEISGTLLIENPLAEFNQQTANWPGTLINFTRSGVSPDEILLLNNASGVDLGLASQAVTAADDFGLTTDHEIIAVIDLGNVG